MPRMFDIDEAPYSGALNVEQMLLALEPVAFGRGGTDPEIVLDVDVEARFVVRGRHVGRVRVRIITTTPYGLEPDLRRFTGRVVEIDDLAFELSRLPSRPDESETPETSGLHVDDGIEGYLELGRDSAVYFWKE